jgi:hypothetical protein
MRKGSSSWGYDEASCEWPGGQAQYSTNDGGAWSNISGSDDDFQCYLGLV